MKKRVVLDTNILISSVLIKFGNPRKIFEKFLNGEFILIESEEMLAEIRDVLFRPKFNYISLIEKENFIKNLLSLCNIVEPKQKIDIIKDDPDDNIILECALEGNADYIISGDEHLLGLKEFKGIKIISPKEFLNILTVGKVEKILMKF